jgi:hypothetical protein
MFGALRKLFIWVFVQVQLLPSFVLSPSWLNSRVDLLSIQFLLGFPFLVENAGGYLERSFEFGELRSSVAALSVASRRLNGSLHLLHTGRSRVFLQVDRQSQVRCESCGELRI